LEPLFRLPGDKKPEGPIFISNSAAQTLVKFAASLPELPRLSTAFKAFSAAVVALSNKEKLATRKTEINSFFTFFSAPPFSGVRPAQSAETMRATD